jgi:DNA-binding transcriptional ArsR family regulator
MPKDFDCLAALRALGEEHRIRLLRLLLERERAVNELAEALDETQYNVSRHLKVLKGACLVEVTRQGQLRIYALAATFRERLSRDGNVLDLGCCQFDFRKLP